MLGFYHHGHNVFVVPFVPVVVKSFPQMVKYFYLYSNVSLKSLFMEYLYPELSKQVLDCAFIVHRELGPGLLESTYETCLMFELASNEIDVRHQYPLPINYKGRKLDYGYRIDLLVNNEIIIEIKSVENIHPVHQAQVLTYMKLSGYRIGFLMNFNVKYLKKMV